MPITTTSGWDIYYETHGRRAAAPLLMILGLSHRLAHWGRLPELLAEQLFVVTFDCRGLGASERRDEPFTIHDEMWDVEAVLDAVGLEAVHVYGRSRGGALAQQWALSRPHRVRSLVLSGTTHFGPGRVGSTPAVERAMNFPPDMSREEIFATQNRVMAAPGWEERDPEAFNYCLSTDLEAPPRRFAVVNQQRSIADWSSDTRLAEFHCPTLILCGEDDGMVPPENSRQLAAGIPGARLTFLPQCGHLPMLEQPETVARLVTDFVTRVS